VAFEVCGILVSSRRRKEGECEKTWETRREKLEGRIKYIEYTVYDGYSKW
jgi:hypothetical protein